MNLRLVSVAIALVVSAMLLGASVYESVVLAPNLQGAPISLEHARGFYHITNPGVFFRVISPATQLLLMVALLCNWRPTPFVRGRLVGALLLAILADLITFQFHYPRNAILFRAPLTSPPADLDRGTGRTGRAGSPIGHEPISRPIVAGPGAAPPAVQGRCR